MQMFISAITDQNSTSFWFIGRVLAVFLERGKRVCIN
jgi:hypothetical protein